MMQFIVIILFLFLGINKMPESDGPANVSKTLYARYTETQVCYHNYYQLVF